MGEAMLGFGVLDVVPTGCCVISEDGVIRFWNQTLEQWTQLEALAMIGQRLEEAFPELAQPRFAQRIQSVFVTGAPAVFSPALNPRFFPCFRPDGRPRIQQTTVNLLALPPGEPACALLTVMDVTDPYERGEKYRQARLDAVREARERAESEAKHRAIVEASSVGILILDEAGVVQDCNPAAVDLFGRPRTGLVNTNLAAVLVESPEVLLRRLQGARNYETQIRDAHGSLVPVEAALRTFEAGGRLQTVLTLHNLTEVKRAEEALRQAQKQESLGLLAGGIAHDFNNAFGAMFACLDLAQDAVGDPGLVMRHLQAIRSEVLRVSELSKKMLAFSGKGRFSLLRLDVGELLREMEPLLQASVSRRVRLSFTVCGTCPWVELDPAQIQQAMLALVTNAAEALPDGQGVVRIRLERMSVGAEETGVGLPPPGDYLGISVEDDGHGIAPENLGRIFDPFYTTKFAGRGLSLAVVLGMARGHQGGIAVESTVGKGTRVTLLLPIQEGTSSQPLPENPAGPGVVGRGQRILLVDDEDLLRESVSELLMARGFDVLTACDGVEAVEAVTQHGASLGLVVLDLTMPRMDGRTAFMEMRKLQPDLPVLITSGYSEQDIASQFRDHAPQGFLQKPYRIAQLEAEARRFLTP